MDPQFFLFDKDLPPLPPPYNNIHGPEPTLEDYDLAKVTSRDQSTSRPKPAGQACSSVSSLEPADHNDSTGGVAIEEPHGLRQRRIGSFFRFPRRRSVDVGEEAKKLRLYDGWRMSVSICAATAGTVLLINSSLSLWASNRYHVSEGLATIHEGSCKKTKTLSLWLHLAINILSTVLLSASNYCMQCLSSPTREEVDRAHHKRVWLDIGVPSVRNLHQISWYRIAIWWALALSGIPLHLLYNSAVFSSLAATKYTVFVASPNFLTIGGVDWSQPVQGGGGLTLQSIRNASHWQRLENRECIIAYGQAFVSAHANVLAISPDFNASGPAAYIDSIDQYKFLMSPAYQWICNTNDRVTGSCDMNRVISQASSWTLQNYSRSSYDEYRQLYGNSSGPPPPDLSVEYCLSEPIEERCRLQFSLIIMGVVIGCNLVKAVCMLLTLRYHKSQPLVTLGDAIASFLDQPDPTTENMCLADKNSFSWKKKECTIDAQNHEEGDHFSYHHMKNNHVHESSPALTTLEEKTEVTKSWECGPKKWQPKPHRWFRGASTRRWLICNALCGGTLIVALLLYVLGVSANQLLSSSFAHLWALGYGTVTSEQMADLGLGFMGRSSGLVFTILLANLPQALLSFLFLTYNGLYTCMLLADEWSGYAHRRKPLRVTSPVGEQRCTYRLQLPYRYGIPLLMLSGTLHWLVSQSLFLARVTVFTADGAEDTQNSISTIGYSSIAIFTVIILGFIVVLLGIGMGFRRYKPGMPLVGSCSAAISAACHRPIEDVDASNKGVMWGVVRAENGVGHCCFTSLEVEPPVEGELYAGQDAGWSKDRFY